MYVYACGHAYLTEERAIERERARKRERPHEREREKKKSEREYTISLK